MWGKGRQTQGWVTDYLHLTSTESLTSLPSMHSLNITCGALEVSSCSPERRLAPCTPWHWRQLLEFRAFKEEDSPALLVPAVSFSLGDNLRFAQQAGNRPLPEEQCREWPLALSTMLPRGNVATGNSS